MLGEVEPVQSKKLLNRTERNILSLDNLQPKVKVETVVCEVPVEKVLKAAQKVLRTGKIGDGKIFVYNLENAVRIRTGEEGPSAIMDPQDS